MSPEPLIKLKSRGAEPMPWDFPDVDPPGVSPDMPLAEAEFVAVDIETTGNRPFLVLEIGAERFRLDSTLSFFDTLVNCRAPINPYARRRHLIERAMLAGAPEFSDARRAFLHFARASILVEHSHDAFDTWIIGRGLPRPLEHPVVDTTALGRLVLELPPGQTPGLARLVSELGLGENPAHAALGDAQATAAVFRELVKRGMAAFGWETVADLVGAFPRPVIDRSSLEKGGVAPMPRKGSSAARGPRGGQGPTAQPRSDEPVAPPGATSQVPSARPGRSRRRRRSRSSGTPGATPAESPGV